MESCEEAPQAPGREGAVVSDTLAPLQARYFSKEEGRALEEAH